MPDVTWPDPVTRRRRPARRFRSDRSAGAGSPSEAGRPGDPAAPAHPEPFAEPAHAAAPEHAVAPELAEAGTAAERTTVSPAGTATEAETVPAGSGGLWSPGYRRLVVGLVLTVTLVAFEALAVITVLPVVSRDLAGLALYGWVTSAFFLGTVVGIVVAGAATDRIGPARPFVAGLTLFSCGLVIAGLAPAMGVLVAGRLVQGLGAGATPAIAYASIGRSMPQSLRPRMFAVLSTAWVVPGLGGPALSALVADHLGWRWVFLGLLPLVLAAGSVATKALRGLGAPPPDAAGREAPADTGPDQRPDRPPLVPALRVSAGAGLMLAGLTSRSPFGLIAVAAGIALGLRPLAGILPAGTLRAGPGVPATVLTRGLLTFCFFGADTFVPLALTSARHTSTATASIAVTSATILWASGSWTQSRLAGRWTGRRLVTVGLAVVLAGIGIVSVGLDGAVPVAVGIAGWGVGGFGIGLAYAPLSLVVLADAPAGRQGAASTAIQLSDNLGTAFGSGIGGVAVAAAKGAGSAPATGVGAAFAIAAAVGVAGLIVARRMPATTVPAS